MMLNTLLLVFRDQICLCLQTVVPSNDADFYAKHDVRVALPLRVVVALEDLLPFAAVRVTQQVLYPSAEVLPFLRVVEDRLLVGQTLSEQVHPVPLLTEGAEVVHFPRVLYDVYAVAPGREPVLVRVAPFAVVLPAAFFAPPSVVAREFVALPALLGASSSVLVAEVSASASVA